MCEFRTVLVHYIIDFLLRSLAIYHLCWRIRGIGGCFRGTARHAVQEWAEQMEGDVALWLLLTFVLLGLNIALFYVRLQFDSCD